MLNDLTGRTFGLLRVISMTPRTQKKTFWLCECECGNVKSIRSDSLTGYKTLSCGCIKKLQDYVNLRMGDRVKSATYESRTRLYRIWQGLNARCYLESNHKYAIYGGRGIAVCREWQRQSGFSSFKNWALANGYNDNLSIDRIDNDGNYEPSNCRWVNNKIQCNNRNSNVKITMNGQTKNMRQWCEELNMDYGHVNRRRQHGMPPEKMFAKGDFRKKH